MKNVYLVAVFLNHTDSMFGESEQCEVPAENISSCYVQANQVSGIMLNSKHVEDELVQI